MCIETGGFARQYHMSYRAYIWLVEILDIKVNLIKSSNSTSGNDPITKEIIAAMGICFMSVRRLSH